MNWPTEGVFLMLLLQQLFTTIPVLTTNVVAPSSYSQKQTTTGREFIFSFLKLYREHVKLCVYLTNQNAEWTTIEVRMPSVMYRIESLLERGETRKINLPSDSQPLSDDMHNNTIIITSDNDISVYGFIYSGDSAGGFLVLPTSVLGRDYFVASYQPSEEEWSQFAVTALHDDTIVTINFRAVVSYRHKVYQPGDRIEKILNSRDSILIKSHEDLTGTHIQSSKAISVISGVSGAIVPDYMQTKDSMITHLIPVNSWGSTFIIPPIPGRRSGYRYRVIASCPLTTITSPTHSQIATLMKPGDFYETGEQKSVLITSVKPIMVIQYANSQAYIEGSRPRGDGDGDTLMLVIPPWDRNLPSNITFTGVQLIGTRSFRSYISVTALCSQIHTLRLNGEEIVGTEMYFDRICTRQALLNPLISSFTVTSSTAESRYLILVYGAALEISYAYPAWFTLRKKTCDGTLSNDASEPLCCEEAENDYFYESADSSAPSESWSEISNSNSYSEQREYSDYAGSSESDIDPSKSDVKFSSFESEVAPSKPDVQLSSFPALNDGPGSSETTNNEVNPTAQRSEDPAFVVDRNGNDNGYGGSATCLTQGTLQRNIVILFIGNLLLHIIT